MNISAETVLAGPDLTGKMESETLPNMWKANMFVFSCSLGTFNFFTVISEIVF